MPSSTPTIPQWIRAFTYPGYVNVYSLDGLEEEPKLFATETLFGDWDAPTLLYAKDAAPAGRIKALIDRGDPNPWRHAMRGRDQKFYRTNERVEEWVEYFKGSKLYGSALAHMLREGDETSGSLRGFTSGPLHDHLRRVLEFVVQNMSNLQAIVCLGNEAHTLVSLCARSGGARKLAVGQSVETELFRRRVLIARLYHPSRPFKGGWVARHHEWRAVAERVNKRISK